MRLVFLRHRSVLTIGRASPRDSQLSWPRSGSSLRNPAFQGTLNDGQELRSEVGLWQVVAPFLEANPAREKLPAVSTRVNDRKVGSICEQLPRKIEPIVFPWHYHVG